MAAVLILGSAALVMAIGGTHVSSPGPLTGNGYGSWMGWGTPASVDETCVPGRFQCSDSEHPETDCGGLDNAQRYCEADKTWGGWACCCETCPCVSAPGGGSQCGEDDETNDPEGD